MLAAAAGVGIQLRGVEADEPDLLAAPIQIGGAGIAVVAGEGEDGALAMRRGAYSEQPAVLEADEERYPRQDRRGNAQVEALARPAAGAPRRPVEPGPAVRYQAQVAAAAEQRRSPGKLGKATREQVQAGPETVSIPKERGQDRSTVLSSGP
jgi:hypothetical protein